MNEYNENYNTNYQQENALPTQDNMYAQSGGTYAPAAPKKKKPGLVCFIVRIALCCIGILVGGLLVFNALAGDDLFFGLGISGWGDYVWGSTKFGADFYTDMYEITQDAAYNTYQTVHILNDGLNIICIVLGFGMALGFGMKLISVIEQRKKQNN